MNSIMIPGKNPGLIIIDPDYNNVYNEATVRVILANIAEPSAWPLVYAVLGVMKTGGFGSPGNWYGNGLEDLLVKCLEWVRANKVSLKEQIGGIDHYEKFHKRED